MRKLIINVIVVVTSVFIFDFAIGKTLRHFYFKEIAGYHHSLTYIMDSTKADVMVFGGSRARAQYVPELFEDSLKMSFYNAGLNGPAFFYQLAILKTVLKRYTPKVIIMDFKGSLAVGGEDQKCYYWIVQVLPYYQEHEETRQPIELRSPYEKIKLVSEIYPFNTEVFAIAMGNLEMNKSRIHIDKGYVPINREFYDKIDTIRNTESYQVDTNRLNAVCEFVSLAKKSGAKVIVIYSPTYERYEKEPQEIDTCRDICFRNNVAFWNYCHDSTFLNNQQLFADPWHLNNKGAVVFSQMLAYRIKNYLRQDKENATDTIYHPGINSR